MTLWHNLLRRSVLTVFILSSVATSAWSQGGGSGLSPFGGELHRFTEFTGQVVCVRCSLKEVRKARPRLFNLYQLNLGQEQIVMQIDTFTDPSDRHYWQTVVGPSDQVTIRAADHVVEELTAEANLFKDLTVTGVLRSTRTLDIGSIKVQG